MHPAFFRSFGKIVFFISCYPGYIKSFGKTDTGFTININHIVGSAFISFHKHRHMQNIFTNKNFIRNLYHFHYTAFGKSNDIIQVRNFCNKFILLQSCPNKPISKICINFNIGNGNSFGLYNIKLFNFCFTFPSLAKFLQQVFVIGNRIIGEIIQIVFYLFDIIFQPFYLVIEFVNI